MSNQQLIIDKGSFAAETQSFALTESFETIMSIHRTVKEYRDYAQPGTEKWEEYIQEFLHMMGFSTQIQFQRILLLRDINSLKVPNRAVAGVVLPNEGFENVTTWLGWPSLLAYAASHNKVDWGILISGLEMKIYHFKKAEYIDQYFWADLDKIICAERLDSFFTIYKLLSYIKGQKISPFQPPEKRSDPLDSPSQSISQQEPRKNTHVANSTFHRTFEMPKVLINILDVYREMMMDGLEFSQACDVIANRQGIFPATIRDACTRRIKLNTEGFRSLVSSKSRFVAYLSQIFPVFSEVIKREVME